MIVQIILTNERGELLENDLSQSVYESAILLPIPSVGEYVTAAGLFWQVVRRTFTYDRIENGTRVRVSIQCIPAPATREQYDALTRTFPRD